MKKNFIKPEDPEHVTTLEEALRVGLITATALGMVLKPSECVIVQPRGDMVDPAAPDVQRLMVYRKGGQLCIDVFSGVVPAGRYYYRKNDQGETELLEEDLTARSN